ncbi:MAG: hypothetical protein AAFN77_19775 [Planctomycetota bacterium]
MAKKRKRPLVKVAPDAISIRSMAVSYCTVLFDDSNLKKLNQSGVDWTYVAYRHEPKKEYDKVRRWAGRGTWLAIKSHPEILDGDGVPGLDLVIQSSNTSRLPKSAKITGPADGFWYDPVTQFLDLRSGKIRFVYDDEFFCEGYDQDADCVEFESIDDAIANAQDAASHSGFIIPCQPGFYQATAFTRFIDEMSDAEPEAGSADLAIYLTPIKKPASFRMSESILPIHPKDQDLVSLRRRASGLPQRQPIPLVKPSVVANGDLKTNLTFSTYSISLDAPPKVLEKSRLQTGTLVQLDVAGIQINGLFHQDQTPDPSIWKLVDKEKKKPGSFAMFTPKKDKIVVTIIKHGRKSELPLANGESVPATLSIRKDRSGNPIRIAEKQSAVGHAESVQVPKRVGKAGPCVRKLIPMIEKCFSWTQVCVFEKNGKTMAAAINISPPQIEVVKGKPKQILGAEIQCIIAEFSQGRLINEQPKGFRNYPEGVDRAFQWAASQVKDCWLWTNRFELELDFWNKNEKSLNKKKAQSAAIDAWKEVLGIDWDS